MTNTLRTWNRKGYTVEEQEFDYNLHKFAVIVDDEKVAEIVPADVMDMDDIIKDLDAGIDVNGWDNGNGETVDLPVYVVETENPKKAALNDHAITEHGRSYSRKLAEQWYNGIFDRGLTVMLSKLQYEDIELIEERVEK